jgi:NAD(P)-dependent dehydrogenase (short-subunit alcohol dehydrogenase family)
MPASGQFAGKVAFVTGAASGIGEATARAFAAEGAAVMIADIQVEQGRAVAEALKAAGTAAAFVECDVRSEAAIEAAVSETVRQFGRLDCAYNNAGIGSTHRLLADMPNEEWDEVMSTNLRGVWWCMKYELRQMLAHGGGAIVNCASILGIVALPNMGSYVAAKHGVIGLTKAAALDYAKQNIRVNAVCPGGILSGGALQAQAAMTREEREAMNAMVLAQQPIGRWGQPEEIANAVVWLCSPGASLMLGHALVVDGGSLVH